MSIGTAARIGGTRGPGTAVEDVLPQRHPPGAAERDRHLDRGTAAQILVNWSHPGRFRSEAAFASFAGVAPSRVGRY
nr:transposase [Streptomyces sp. B3I8]